MSYVNYVFLALVAVACYLIYRTINVVPAGEPADEDENKYRPEPACKRCGHDMSVHSPCSPMGCTQCECPNTPSDIARTAKGFGGLG